MSAVNCTPLLAVVLLHCIGLCSLLFPIKMTWFQEHTQGHGAGQDTKYCVQSADLCTVCLGMEGVATAGAVLSIQDSPNPCKHCTTTEIPSVLPRRVPTGRIAWPVTAHKWGLGVSFLQSYFLFVPCPPNINHITGAPYLSSCRVVPQGLRNVQCLYGNSRLILLW